MEWTWGLLAPKGWAGVWIFGGVLGGVLANVNFSETVTLGSILTAAIVVIAGGLFSFRNNMRTFWRNLAVERQEQIKVLEERLLDSTDKFRESQEKSHTEMAAVLEEQRVVRHELKGQLAAAEKLLAAEHAKTDLSLLMEQLGQQHSDAMARMQEGLDRQAQMLRLLEASIPAEAIPPDLKHDMGDS